MNTQKKKLGIVSYIGIGLSALIVLATIVICLLDFIYNKGVYDDYSKIGPLLVVFISIPYLVYYAITTIISISIDLSKGKSKGKDITISILYGLPIVCTIVIVLFVVLLTIRS